MISSVQLATSYVPFERDREVLESVALYLARRSPGANKRDENWNVDAELVKAGAPAGDTEAPSSDAVEELLRQLDGYAKALYDEDQPLSQVLHDAASTIRSLREERDAAIQSRDTYWRQMLADDAALRELREKVDNRLGVMLAEKSGLPESTHSHLCEMSRAVLAEFDASLRSAAPEGTTEKRNA